MYARLPRVPLRLGSPWRVTSGDGRETSGSPSAIVSGVTFTATAVLPYDNLERATAGLRGRLRLMAVDHGADAPPDWTTLVVTGPLECQIVMTVDIVDGRLACTSLTAERLDDGSPVISGELLRRIPVATYVRLAALDTRFVLLERVEGRLREVDEMPPKDFAKKGMTDEALDQFARLYALIQVSGGKPSGILLNDYGMPRATFSRWLATARRRGILVEEHERFAVDYGQR